MAVVLFGRYAKSGLVWNSLLSKIDQLRGAALLSTAIVEDYCSLCTTTGLEERKSVIRNYIIANKHIDGNRYLPKKISHRWSSSGKSGQGDGYEEESKLLQSVRAADFHPHLNMLKKSRQVLSYDELLHEFHTALPYASERDAVIICDALSVSGSIIKSGDMVYLHPEEIAQTLRGLLPVDVSVLRMRLDGVEKKLKPMEDLKDSIRRNSNARTMAFNYGFFVLMAAQWGIFFRLCYWELSWDIVEPLGFFANGATTMLSFAWFLRTRRDFTFEGMSDTFMSNYERKALLAARFDFVEYERLQQEAKRLREALKSHSSSSSLSKEQKRSIELL
eukprot:jgi/Picsp_1/4584/NSC_01954-R1_protein